MVSQKAQVAIDAIKVSPAAAVVGTHILGVNWPDVAYIMTFIYTAYLFGSHVIRQIIKWKNKDK